MRADPGQLFRGERYPWLQLLEIGREQNQAFAPVPLLECQYPLDGKRIERVATKSKHGFSWISDNATLREYLAGDA